MAKTPVPDPIPPMLDELDAMPARARAAILASLTPVERETLERLREPKASGTAVDVHGCSPWLAARLEEARRNGDDTGGTMTKATCDALLHIVRGAMEAPGAMPGAGPTEKIGGRSLAGVFGGLLATRGARR